MYFYCLNCCNFGISLMKTIKLHILQIRPWSLKTDQNDVSPATLQEITTL